MRSRYASRDVSDSGVHSEFSPGSASGEFMRSLQALITSPAGPPQKSGSCRNPIRPSRRIRVTIVEKIQKFRCFPGCVMICLGMASLTWIIAAHLEWSERIRYFRGDWGWSLPLFWGGLGTDGSRHALSLFQWAGIYREPVVLDSGGLTNSRANSGTSHLFRNRFCSGISDLSPNSPDSS
jgi:hypothetical protein